MPRVSLLERIYLELYSWLSERFDTDKYWKKTKSTISSINRSFPVTHTKKYDTNAIWIWYPWYCFGGIALLSFIVLCVTGTILGLYYVPSAEGSPPAAYKSMEIIMTEIPFGYILRALHHWATHVMVASVFLHTIRVYFTGAYRKPREFNWIIGMFLMIFTLFFAYTGYILPWDQLSYWAGRIGIDMAKAVPIVGEIVSRLLFGDVTMSGNTLIRFYLYHVYILPGIVIGLIVLHLIIVWYQGIAEPH